ncbi:MAG: hypothetical protein ACK5II_03125 [Paracoccus sp. (in: a-proteobacteria)]
MLILPAIIALVFAISFLTQPMLGAGWLWEVGNGLGFWALAGLLFQMIPLHRTDGARRHQTLGYWVLSIGFAHAFWMLATDSVVRVYLMPGAPAYMWLGLIGLMTLAMLTVLAQMPDRMRIHKQFRSFRLWHRWLGILTVAAAVGHILLSSFYLSGWWQAVLLLGLATGCCLGRRIWSYLHTPLYALHLIYALVGGVFVSLFTIIRNLP